MFSLNVGGFGRKQEIVNQFGNLELKSVMQGFEDRHSHLSWSLHISSLNFSSGMVWRIIATLSNSNFSFAFLAMVFAAFRS